MKLEKVRVIRVLQMAAIVVGFVALVAFLGIWLSFESAGPYQKGNMVDRWYDLTGRSFDLASLKSDSYGYVTVESGQKVWFPLKNWHLEEELFVFSDYFGIVGVLGNPADSDLTSFEGGDIWLLLQSYRVKHPQFLIFQWKWQTKEAMDSSTISILGRLKEMFEAEEFTAGNGRPEIKPTGFFFYVRKDNFWKTNDQNPRVIDDPVYSDKASLVVNEGDHALPIHAKIFASKSIGQLVVTLDQGKERTLSRHVKRGWWFTRVTYRGYSLRVVIVDKKDVKCRPELDQALPDVSSVWFDSPLINWEEVSDPKVAPVVPQPLSP